MTENSTDALSDLADQIDDEFEAYRQSNQFKDISLVIDNNEHTDPTLIVHIDGDDAGSLASRSMNSFENVVHELNENNILRPIYVC